MLFIRFYKLGRKTPLTKDDQFSGNQEVKRALIAFGVKVSSGTPSKRCKSQSLEDDSDELEALNLPKRNRYSKPVEINNVASDASQQLDVIEMDGSRGDCAYDAFPITRKDAYRLLMGHVNETRYLLRLCVLEVIHDEAISGKHAFIEYLKDVNEAPSYLLRYVEQYHIVSNRKDGRVPSLPENIDRFVNDLAVIGHYLKCDLLERKSEMGWCHPRVLQALAHIQGLRLRIWRRSSAGSQQILPHALPSLRDFNSEKEECIDLIYNKGVHFDKLVPVVNRAAAERRPRQLENDNEADTDEDSPKRARVATSSHSRSLFSPSARRRLLIVDSDDEDVPTPSTRYAAVRQ